MNKRIIIGGGGTGGHVFPAVSVANAIKEIMPGAEILFVGARGRLEMEKVPEAGYKIEGLPVTGLYRSFSLKNLTSLMNLLRSCYLAKRIIRKFKPNVAFGVGGYASGPVLWAANKAGVPTIILEQNSYAGITNRMLAKNASLICVAYEEMEKYFPKQKIIITGNPVRKEIIRCNEMREKGLKYFDLVKDKPVVLAIGGSLGARTINQTISNNLTQIPENIQLIWQTGKLYFNQAQKRLSESGRKGITVLPFIEDMNLAYACADIIVSRAGAGTISELAIVGKPVILIPSPNVAEDHQTKNAKALTEKNAGILVTDHQANSKLIATIQQLMDDEEMKQKLSENIRKFAISDAAGSIAQQLLKLAEKQ